MADNQAESREQQRKFQAAQHQQFIAEGQAALKRMQAGDKQYARQKQAKQNRNNWDALLKVFKDEGHKIEVQTDRDTWEWCKAGPSYFIGHSKDYSECAKKHIMEDVRRGTTTSLITVLKTVGLFGHNWEWYEGKTKG